MARFWYVTIDNQGTEHRGTIDAVNERTALQNLTESGLTVLDISDEPLSTTGNWLTRDISFGAGRLRDNELTEFCRIMATLLKAHLSLEQTLLSGQRLARSKRIAARMGDLHARLLAGTSLAAAMEERPNTYPKELRSFVMVGENANTLGRSFAAAYEHFKTKSGARDQLTSLLIYPVILVIFAVIVLALTTFYLAPTLSEAISGAGGNVTGALAILLSVQEFATQSPLNAVAIVVGGAFGTALLVRYVFPLLWRWVIAAIPWFRGFRNEAVFAGYAKTLSVLLQSGSRLETALDDIANIYAGDQSAVLFEDARDALRNGLNASEAFSDRDNSSVTFQELFRLGEESNQLAEMMSLAAEQLGANVAARRTRMLQLLTPALTLVIGGGIGFLVYTMLSAILEVNQLAF